MKHLVIENDDRFEDQMLKYIDSLEGRITLVPNVDQVGSDEMIEMFGDNTRLHYAPTMISKSQHNLLMMMMYKLLKEGKLGIRSIYIVYYDKNTLLKELQWVWEDKRKYLDEVLQHVKVFYVGKQSHEGYQAEELTL